MTCVSTTKLKRRACASRWVGRASLANSCRSRDKPRSICSARAPTAGSFACPDPSSAPSRCSAERSVRSSPTSASRVGVRGGRCWRGKRAVRRASTLEHQVLDNTKLCSLIISVYDNIFRTVFFLHINMYMCYHDCDETSTEVETYIKLNTSVYWTDCNTDHH